MTANRYSVGARRRRGLTLVELLIVIVLLSIVVGGMMGVLLRQQQFYSGATGVLDTRTSVRQGIDVLQSDLRALAPASGDIRALTQTSIVFRQQFGASVVCSAPPGATTITIAPRIVIRGSVLTSWASTPQSGDSVFIYDSDDPGSPLSAQAWRSGQLDDAAKPNATCDKDTGLTSDDTEAATGWSLKFTQAVNGTISAKNTIRAGSAIRFFRLASYQLFQAADNNWYLGYARCTSATTCDVPDPVSGPYLGADVSAPGVEFSYYDAAGNLTTDRMLVRRIDIILRAQSERQVNMLGRAKGFYRDSLKTSIAVRN